MLFLEPAVSAICSLNIIFIACSAFVIRIRQRSPVKVLLFEGFDISLSPDHFSIFRIHHSCEMCFFIQDWRRTQPSNDAVFGNALFVRADFLRWVPFGSFQRCLPQVHRRLLTVDTLYDYTVQESLERIFVSGFRGLIRVLFSRIVIGSNDEVGC